MSYTRSNYSRRRSRRWCSECRTLSLLFTSLFLFVQTNLSVAAVKDETQAMMYLSEYGYLSPKVRNPQSGQIMSEETLSRAIMEFQDFAGLNLTGYLDDATVQTMSLPRCGVRDKVGYAMDSRSKRYALQGSRWRRHDLTYRVSKYSNKMNKEEVEDEVQRAFDVWSSVTPLTFRKKTSGPVHIDLKFETYEHGDNDPFDGPGGTLAHAFFPLYGGDVHFDDSEKWTVRVPRGTNFFQVAAHEIGHSLGLSHSEVRSALMAPFYRGYEPNFKLHEDDIQGIQALYGAGGGGGGGSSDGDDEDSFGAGSGKPTSTVKPPPTTTTSPPHTNTPATTDGDPELCNDGSFDAIFNSKEGVTYVFKGQQYWKLTEDGIAAGYPKTISQSWIGLPGNIDTAFTYKNGKTYFFKGSKYWRYDGKKMDGDYPKDINDGFPGIPDNVQASMVWSGNGKIYFFKGGKFWKFDTAQKPPVKSTYPKPISNWEGIPEDLDDALQYTNGYTYFFKGGKYYRFNDRTFAVDTTDPPFPRNIGYWWFGCKAESKSDIKHKNNDQQGSASNYRPTFFEIRRDHRINQNIDVSDIILDADKKADAEADKIKLLMVSLLRIVVVSFYHCLL